MALEFKITNKGGEENFEDRISELPDDILVIILSGLPVRDAQATSALSKRWRYTWANITNLNFDDEKNLCLLYELKKNYHEGVEGSELLFRYVDWVDSVLKMHRAQKIEHFRVSFDIGLRSTTLIHKWIALNNSIDEWIHFALKRGVQTLELDFLDYPNGSAPENYSLGRIISRVKKASGLNPLFPASEHLKYVGFKSLKVLDLKAVSVTGAVLENILSNSPVLERLSVSDSFNSDILRVISPSTALKYLVIRRCHRVKRIEISDANLVSFVNDIDGKFFKYGVDEVDLLLKNLPLLVEVSLGGQRSLDFLEVASQISCCLSQLEILKLNYLSLSYSKEYVFPTLSSLKHLELANCDLLLLASFFKAAPLLRTLKLQLHKSRVPFRNKKAGECIHHNLKVVEIVCYLDTTDYIELVKYVTKAAIKLEKIVFNSVRLRDYRSRVDRLVRNNASWRKAWLSPLVHEIEKELPASVEVVCL